MCSWGIDRMRILDIERSSEEKYIVRISISIYIRDIDPIILPDEVCIVEESCLSMRDRCEDVDTLIERTISCCGIRRRGRDRITRSSEKSTSLPLQRCKECIFFRNNFSLSSRSTQGCCIASKGFRRNVLSIRDEEGSRNIF